MSGIERRRRPVASKIAFATAGATATIGVSPAPAGATSLWSIRITSIGGTSVKRGTRYVEKRRVEDLAVLEVDRFEQRAPETHHRRPLDLIHQTVGVHDRSAVERGHDPDDLHPAVRIGADLDARGDPRVLLDAARDADPVPGVARRPAETRSLGRRLVHRREPVVSEMAQTERQGIVTHLVRQLVQVRLAGEMVRRRGECPVRALPQR